MKLNIDAVKLMRQVTLHVHAKRTTEARWRIRLGVWLMCLGARAIGCNITIRGEIDGGS